MFKSENHTLTARPKVDVSRKSYNFTPKILIHDVSNVRAEESILTEESKVIILPEGSATTPTLLTIPSADSSVSTAVTIPSADSSVSTAVTIPSAASTAFNKLISSEIIDEKTSRFATLTISPKTNDASSQLDKDEMSPKENFDIEEAIPESIFTALLLAECRAINASIAERAIKSPVFTHSNTPSDDKEDTTEDVGIILLPRTTEYYEHPTESEAVVNDTNVPKAYSPLHAHVFTNGEEDSSYEKNNYANEELDGEDYVSTSLLTNPPLAAPSSERVAIGEPASVKIESERGRARSDATVKQPSPIFLIDKTEAIKIITNLYKLIKDYLDEKKCEPFYKVDIQLDEDYLITYMITDEFGNIDKTTVSRSIAELVDEYKIKVLDMKYNLTFCGRALEVDVIAGSPLKAPSTLTIGKNAKIIITEGGFVQPGLKIICTDKTSIFIATKGEVIDSAHNIDYATSAEEIYCLGSNAAHLTEHHE